MRNIELHTIESATDIDSAIVAGLLDIEDIDGAECFRCYEEVGYVNGGFYSYAVVLDDIHQWTVCLSCASIVIDEDDLL
jgi:hypothetical protein